MMERTRIRRPFAAALLSLVVTGLGQLYNGRPWRAAVLYGLEITLSIALVLKAGSLLSPTGIAVLYGAGIAGIALKLFAIGDAFAGARRIGSIAQGYDRWYVYLALILVSVAMGFLCSGHSYCRLRPAPIRSRRRRCRRRS
jgi:TM2 domain-containing membrane protein YozV